MKIPATVPGAEFVGGFILALVLGAYALLATYLLSRGLPRAGRNRWIVLALNAVLLLVSLIALLTEPNKQAALQMLGIAAISSVCSYAGLALAARTAKPAVAP